MSKIILLVGQIGSGKSTYIKENIKSNTVIVNDDSIVASIHGGYNNLYDPKLKPLYKNIENEIIHFAKVLNLNVIIDRPNTTKNTRSRYISIARSLDMKIECVVFPLYDYKTHAERRFKSDSRDRSKEEWESIARTKQENYEKPHPIEQFNQITYLGKK